MGGRPRGSKNSPGMAGTAFTSERKQKYCAALQQHGEPALARATVGVSHATVYRHRLQDPDFRAMEDEALEQYRSSVHQAIHRRAIEGWEEPVYHNGVVVGSRRRYSDALLLAHAKRHSPELYGDKVKVDQTTHVDSGLGLALEQLGPESRALLRRVLELEADAAS